MYLSGQTENDDKGGMCFGCAAQELGTFTPDRILQSCGFFWLQKFAPAILRQACSERESPSRGLQF